MPIYTYECDECGVRFDARQKFTDDPIAECPECGGYTHRVPQPVGVVFKGSGWYVKDSRGQNNLATPPKRENGKNEKSETKSDAPSSSPSSSSTSTETSTTKES
jgi:putative FmdB family regulatory protein